MINAEVERIGGGASFSGGLRRRDYAIHPGPLWVDRRRFQQQLVVIRQFGERHHLQQRNIRQRFKFLGQFRQRHILLKQRNLRYKLFEQFRHGLIVIEQFRKRLFLLWLRQWNFRRPFGGRA
jgi:hypothetical protein